MGLLLAKERQIYKGDDRDDGLVNGERNSSYIPWKKEVKMLVCRITTRASWCSRQVQFKSVLSCSGGLKCLSMEFSLFTFSKWQIIHSWRSPGYVNAMGWPGVGRTAS